jgi:hypothetical protein
MKKSQTKFELPKETPVLVIAWHKTTNRKVENVMTFGEWLQLKKDSKWVYKCLQLPD